MSPDRDLQTPSPWKEQQGDGGMAMPQALDRDDQGIKLIS